MFKLSVTPDEHSIILTESELNIDKDRETMAQIIFEEFRMPGLYIGNESDLTLRWSRHSMGVIVDCCFIITTIVPFANRRRLSDSTLILNYGGHDVTSRLVSLLRKSGHRKFKCTNFAHLDVARVWKEKHGQVMFRDPDPDFSKWVEVTCTLFGKEVSCQRLTILYY